MRIVDRGETVGEPAQPAALLERRAADAVVEDLDVGVAAAASDGDPDLRGPRGLGRVSAASAALKYSAASRSTGR